MYNYQIFRNLDGRTGSCYMEVLPGPYKERCWNDDSLFFDEDADGFGIVETIICHHVPSYDHYANTAIDSHTCWDIIRDLEKLIGVLASDASLSDLQRLPVFQRHAYFFTDVENNRPALLKMVTELVAWLRDVLNYYRSITILGM
ncbi:hypothetical protein [Propionivibrio sp.]|uniref:hypothetical protein n=1 Tax=Propionivibrio sp. TaxID=2212460 RepID=UPI003BF2D433